MSSLRLAAFLAVSIRMVAAWVAALVAVGVVDAANVTLRGGGWAHWLGLGWLAAAAVVVGLGATLGLAAVRGLGALLAWPIRRRWPQHRLAEADAWAAGVLALGLAAALLPAHAIFAKHIAGAALTSAYAVVPIYLICLWFLRALRRAPTARRRPTLGLALAGVAVVGVHAFNAAVFTHLYPGLHIALTGLTVALAVVATTLAFVAWPARRALLALGAGALLVPLGALSDPQRVRGPAFFFGTELAHFHAALEWVFDRDGDGFAAVLGGGDCDDADPRRHPLAREVAGNGVDEDCSGADAGSAVAPARAGAPTLRPELAAWRAAHPRPNVVVFFIDTLRVDHVGAYGGPSGLTPHLDALAARAVVFEQARSPVPRTPHATMSMLRGRFLGRVLDDKNAIAPPADTLVQALWRAGYQTGARLVGQNWAKFHLEGGWDRLIKGSGVGRRHGHEVTKSALELIDGARSPFFLMFHYADPHAPYAPGHPGSMTERYADEVQFTDAQVGEVLAHLQAKGRLDDTIIVVMADHGEDLGDHGGSGGHHGVSVFDEVVRVPLLIAAPGLAPRRVAGGVSLADLAPTLLDLVGGPPLSQPDGCSLVGPLFGTGPTPAFNLSEFYDFGLSLRAIEADGHKLVVDVRRNVHRLFDLRADPAERVDRAAEDPERVASLRALLDAWVAARDTPGAGPARCR